MRFRLVVRSCDGPWGKGSVEAAGLVFNDDVRAILASLDGRNAHLVEQVATKARVAMVSCRGSDPTLSRAFVPWYFRCVPDDEQQAGVLAREIVARRKLQGIAVVSDNGYDGQMASDCFVEQARLAGDTEVLQFIYDDLKPDPDAVIARIVKSGSRNVVLFGTPDNTLRLLRELKAKVGDLAFFGPQSILGEGQTLIDAIKACEGMVMVSSPYWYTEKGLVFRQEFRKAYGCLPGTLAAHAYDGMNIIMQAILEAGTDRDDIIRSITGTRHEGITGIIRFGKLGNRAGEPELAEIKNGMVIPLGRK